MFIYIQNCKWALVISSFIVLTIIFVVSNRLLSVPSYLYVKSVVKLNPSRNQMLAIIPPLGFIHKYPGHYVPDTTTTLVPELFRAKLTSLAPINETVADSYPAKDSVTNLEAIVGWDSVTSDFVNSSILVPMLERGIRKADFEDCLSNKQKLLKDLLNGRELHQIMDIVIPSIRDLDFLEKWRPFISSFHIILIQDGDPTKSLKIPDWADFELYNRLDIEKALGPSSWIISERDASIRNFGFLVSKKKYVWSVDDDCFPATGPNGQLVDAITEHAINLLTPSTPYFFNTVYDPYRQCVDFVRGYPYSLRGGVQTAVSHGLWMNMYDYDAPTQLLKVRERNTRYLDMALTIPKRVLYPLCSMNVAFDRELLGPALMQGLMGSGQPWGRYDDMFSGWASKVVADHLGLGTKSGAPYVLHNKASNPFTNLAKEYMGLQWQEDAIRFFDAVQLSAETDTPSAAYVELSQLMEKELVHLSPYFSRLALAMRVWVEVWNKPLKFQPSRTAAKPAAARALTSKHIEHEGGVTYTQRYKYCLELRRNASESHLSHLFLHRGRNGEADEVAVLRMGRWNSTHEDYWISVCAFVTEVTTGNKNRHVILHVPERHTDAIPPAFRSLVVSHNETKLKEALPVFVNGWSNGDVLVASLLRLHPEYRFAWVFEEDCRYTGNWGHLLDKNLNDTADLLVWNGRRVSKTPPNGTWWFLPKNYYGQWATKMPPLAGAHTMGFRMSFRLSQFVYDNTAKGNMHKNQEANLPTNALVRGYSVVNLKDQKKEWECCFVSQAYLMYREFLANSSSTLPHDFLLHKVY